MTSDRMAPAEISCAATAVLHPERISEMGLTEEQFGDPRVGGIYGAARALYERGKAVEPVSVAQFSGIDFSLILDVIDQGFTANPSVYAEQVREGYLRRRAGESLLAIRKGAPVAEELSKLLTLTEAPSSRMMRVGDGVRAALERLESGSPGTDPGFVDWRDKIGPLGPGQLIVLGARPAMGKTALALSVALRCSGRALFISGEQPAEEISLRALAQTARLDYTRLVRNQLRGSGQSIASAVSEMDRSGLVIADMDSPSLADVIAAARREHAREPLSLLIVDYLQRMRVDPDASRAYAIGDNAAGLKTLARQLGIPVLVLGQVAREVERRQDQRPKPSDLKDSGVIEQEADVICMLYRHEVAVDSCPPHQRGQAELLFEKNRHGPTGRVLLRFDGPSMRFDNLAREENLL